MANELEENSIAKLRCLENLSRELSQWHFSLKYSWLCESCHVDHGTEPETESVGGDLSLVALEMCHDSCECELNSHFFRT